MSIFEYVIVLVSVVLSFGIVRLLETHAHLLKLGSKVHWSPTYLLWLLIILFSHIDLWASLWMLRQSEAWTLLSLLSVLAAAVTLFYASIFSAPEFEPGQAIDLWAFHMENRRRYIGAAAGYLLMGIILNMTMLAGQFDWATVLGALPGLGLLLAAIFVPDRRAQIIIPIVVAVMLTVYFSTYFATLHG
ncbi:MAG: hypothetical protein WCJ52_05685 [Phenylobacterium sp.]|uniref:hypothetical protein n=1 Tax=Phenylobacterium sp. TaxID=1871053 RepID=UPI0030164E02